MAFVSNLVSLFPLAKLTRSPGKMFYCSSLPPRCPILLTLVLIPLLLPQYGAAIQCYSGNQFSIIECPSLYCIKQTLGLDTVRYCDGTGVSSICSTYRIIDTCQNVPNLGYICCCADQLCNSSPHSQPPVSKMLLTAASAFAVWALVVIRKTMLF